MAREAEPTTQRPFGTEDGSVTGTIESDTEPQVVVGEGYHQVTGAIGGQPVQCFVYPKGQDVGEVIRTMAGHILESVEAIERSEWVQVRAGQQAGWPYVMAEAHYLVGAPDGLRLGSVKFAGSTRSGTTVLCVLDAPGFVGSFERVFGGLLASLQLADAPAQRAPDEASITRTDMGPRAVSISRDERFNVEGGYDARSFGTQLSIGPDGSLSAEDSAENAEFRGGALQSGVYASGRHGEMQMHLQLRRDGDAYHVEGDFQGKPIQGDFQVPGGIPDSDVSNAKSCEVRDGKLESVTLADYEPSSNPLAVTEARITRSTVEGFDLMAEIMSVAFHAAVDERCELLRGRFEVGPVTVRIERLWAHPVSGANGATGANGANAVGQAP